MPRPCSPTALVAAALACVLVFLAASGVEAVDSFPVRCSRSCHGQDTCLQMCAGEMKQTGKCEAMAPCAKPDQNPALCPSGREHCQFGPWSDWKNDTAKCSGLCVRSRDIAQVNRCGGDACNGSLSMTKTCFGNCNLIQRKDCVFSFWSAWGKCGDPSKNQKHRSRKVTQQPLQGGLCEGPLEQTAVCAPALSGSNCEVSAWMPWNPCSKTCAGGQYIRFRTIAQRASAGGLPCKDSMSESAPCNVGVACGVAADCQFSNWGEWLGWLGGGVQKTRTRVVSVPATAGGKACIGRLQETQAWDLSSTTPVNCAMSAWSSWGICDKTCSGGQSFRQRNIIKDAQNGGVACVGDVKETMECNTNSCSLLDADLNCKMSRWSEWSSCSASCGVGMQTRNRKITQQAKRGGEACTGPLETLQGCKTVPCAVTDCQWSSWGEWSECPVTCGESHQRRERKITARATPGGKECLAENVAEVKRCAVAHCESICTDGSWSQWAEWSQCTKSCSGGYRTQKRRIAVFGSSCGKNATGSDVEVQSCNAFIKCTGDADCMLSEWSAWAAYPDYPVDGPTKECGRLDWRTRQISAHGEGHGMYCGMADKGESLEEAAMSEGFIYGDKCKITKKTDCKLGAWGAWGACTQSCEGGIAKRQRKVEIEPSRTGTACLGPLIENKPCNEMSACSQKVDCRFSAWNEWSMCTKCSGQKFRTRTTSQLAFGVGARQCRDTLKQVKRCPKNCGTFTNFFCIWSAWSPWSSCATAHDGTSSTSVCGNGIRTRKMVLGATEQQPDDGDYASLASKKEDCRGDRVESKDCNAGPCGPCVPEDCVFSPWLAWSWPTCEGICMRTREFVTQQNSCGKPCVGSMNSTKRCVGIMGACEKKDCELAPWAEWSRCESVLGQKYRSRSVKHHPRNKGQPCVSNLNETAPCLQKSDMVSCQMEAWNPWHPCSRTCGGGHKERLRKVLRESSRGGAACSGLTQQAAPCNTQKCVSDSFRNCEMAPWGSWTACNASAETQSFRWRHILHPAIGSGMPCAGHLQETQSCVELGPVDCKFSEWTAWAACSSTCFGGQQQRSRSIASYAMQGGQTCRGKMIMMRPCAGATPGNCKGVACKLSDWNSWTSCNPSCGNGQKDRRRVVEVPPGVGGASCPSVLAEVAVCTSAPCSGDVDCKWADWEAWQPCVPAEGPCGIGYKRRKRGFISQPVGAGRQCPPRIKEELMPVTGCNGQRECCRDAVWAVWAEWSGCSITCGGGTRTRKRALATKETWCGKPAAGSDIEYESCNAKGCGYQNCMLSQWTAWLPITACPGPCSEGHAERTRFVQAHAHGGGEPCVGSTHEWERCPHESTCTSYVPVSTDCVVGEWSAWSECSQTCAKGYRHHTRQVKVPPKYGGKACPSVLEELMICNADIPCSSTAPVACVWNAWTEWSSCANKEQKSSRGYLVKQANAGVACAGPQEKVRPCGLCANSTYSCGWGDWVEWGPCTATCGTGGSRNRMRSLLTGEPMMDRLYDSSLPKVINALLEEDSKEVPELQEAKHAQDIIFAIAVGGISLAVALIARNICSRRRFSTEDADCDSYKPVEMGGAALE